MKSLLAAAAATVLLFSTPILADFHIVEIEGTYDKYGVPSNQYNCNGLINHSGEIEGELGGSLLTMRNQNLCGASNLDFYKQSDGTYVFYIHDGDGTAQGQCYYNTQSGGHIGPCDSEYISITAEEKMVCYTYFCN